MGTKWQSATAMAGASGVRMVSAYAEWIITKPETITAAAIDKEFNQEIKRVMIERFG